MTESSRVVIVTGAAGGIGRAVCSRLAAAGWHVLAVDRDAGGLDWVASRGNVVGHVADVRSEQENRDMVDKAEARFGGLDAVVLNAAVTTLGTVESTPWEDFQNIIAVNLLGVALGMRAALPALRRRGGGSILATSSLHGIAGEAGQAAYAASKHGVIGLVKSVARDVGWEGIRVNAVCPGLTRDTGMTRAVEELPQAFQALANQAPLKRWGEADEIAAVMEFLLSPAASYVNGVALPVDGGVMTGTSLLPPAGGAHD